MKSDSLKEIHFLKSLWGTSLQAALWKRPERKSELKTAESTDKPQGGTKTEVCKSGLAQLPWGAMPWYHFGRALGARRL